MCFYQRKNRHGSGCDLVKLRSIAYQHENGHRIRWTLSRRRLIEAHQVGQGGMYNFIDSSVDGGGLNESINYLT